LKRKTNLAVPDFSDRKKEKQMNVNAKGEHQPDGHEADSSFEGSIDQITGNPDSETGDGTQQSAGEVEGGTSVGRPKQEEIARLAYECGQRRGCPIGTPEEDWLRAEEQIKQGLNEVPVPNGDLT
jgi:hypothetical protein